MIERLEAVVHGRVQGVGFRWFVRRTASGLGLAGWVANSPDGTVAVTAEGDPAALDRLLAALHEGPAGARVSRVATRRVAGGGTLAGFEIRSGGHPGD
jgi:acylphosphatase